MNIHVNVVNQELQIATNLKCLAEGSQEFVRFIFNMQDDWDDLLVFAQFVQGNTGYNIYLDNENAVYLPPELEPGDCYLVLYGTGNSVIATTNCVKLHIHENHFVADAQSVVITESLYEQLVDIVISSTSTPTPVTHASEMINHQKLYLYRGSETGYKVNHWYYWGGSSWVDGGKYVADEPDSELSPTSELPVQNKVITNALNNKVDTNRIGTLTELQNYIG